DSHPYVQHHDGAKQYTEVNPEGAADENKIREIEIGYDQEEGDDHCDRLILDQLPQAIVNEENNHDGQHRADQRPFVGNGSVRVNQEMAPIVNHAQQQKAGQPGVGGAPSEKIKNPRYQFRNDLLFGIGVIGFRQTCIYEVEEIELTDPHDSGQDV